MRSKISAPIASGLFFVMAAGLAWYTWRQNSRLDPSLHALRQRQSTLAAKIALARDQMDARRQSQAELQARIQSLHASKVVAAQDNSGDDALKRESLATLVTSDPHLLDLYLKSYRLGLRRQYSAAYQALGLAPSQIDKLEDLATEHEAEGLDIRASAEAQGLTNTDPGIQAMLHESNEQEKTAAAEVIGLSWQLIQASSAGRVQPLQSEVSKVAMQVAYDAEPMTSAQAAQLTQILANNSSTYQSGGRATPNSIDWDSAAVQAAGTLPPAQVQAMTTFGTLNALLNLVRQFNATQPQAAPAK
jgi:hypothetical protein